MRDLKDTDGFGEVNVMKIVNENFVLQGQFSFTKTSTESKVYLKILSS